MQLRGEMAIKKVEDKVVPYSQHLDVTVFFISPNFFQFLFVVAVHFYTFNHSLNKLSRLAFSLRHTISHVRGSVTILLKEDIML